MGAGKTAVIASSYYTTNSFVSLNGKEEVIGYGQVGILLDNISGLGGTIAASVVAYPSQDFFPTESYYLTSGVLITSGQKVALNIDDAIHYVEVFAASNAANVTGSLTVVMTQKRRQ